MPRKVLRIQQGADFSLTFDVPGVSPNAVVASEIRRWAGGELLGRFSARVNPGVGTVTISLTEVETARLTRSGVYDLLVTSGAQTVLHSYGPAIVIPRVSTRPSPATAESGLLLDDISQPWDSLSDDLTWEKT